MKVKINHQPLLNLLILTILLTNISMPQITIAPKPVYFGTTPTGIPSEREIIVYNMTSSNINITNIIIKDGSSSKFSLQSNPAPITLQPLASLYLYISYVSASPGKDIAVLEIQTNKGTFYDTLIAQSSLTISNISTFDRIIGTTGPNAGDDSPTSIKETTDGGYLIVGATQPVDQNYPQILAVKTDNYGKPQWIKTYGGNYNDIAYDAIELQDGYIIIGSSDSYGSGSYDVFIMKIDKNGNLIWNKSFQTYYDENAYKIIPSPDNNFIICGDTKNTPDRSSNALVMKVNSNGDILWKKNYGDSGGEIANDIVLTPDKTSYVLTGVYSNPSTGKMDVLLIKIDTSGNIIWNKKIGGPEDDLGSSIDATTDGGFIVSGYTASYGNGGRDAMLIKLDASGNIQWLKTFGTSHNDSFSDVIRTSNDEFIATGYINEYFSLQFIYNNIFILKTDQNGNLIWQTQFGGPTDDLGLKVIPTNPNGYLILGVTSSFAPRSKIYLIKVNEEGKLTNVQTPPPPTIFTLNQNYPNPFNSETIINFSIEKKSIISLKIYDILGRLVHTLLNYEPKEPGYYSLSFNAQNLPSGVYIYKLNAIDPNTKSVLFSSSKKMILLK